MSKIVGFLLLFSSIAVPACAHADLSPAVKIYQNVSGSILTIVDVNKGPKPTVIEFGSGVAVSEHIIATNCHVALKGESHLIKFDGKFYPTKLIYQNVPDDLCLLQQGDVVLVPVKIRPSKEVNIGEEVYTIGSPKGFEKTISHGIISNEIHYKDTVILQTDAPISPGSSGGGLFDSEGKLIGITFFKDKSVGTEGIGFAVPTELILEVLKTANLA